MIYTALSARWRASSIRLPEEPSDDALEELSESQKSVPERLTGRRILLLWLPAVCDLTGTTVRSHFLFLPFRSTATYLLCNCGPVAHECWFVVYPGVNLSDDAWSAGTFRWGSFRAVLASQAIYLPVRVPARVPFCHSYTLMRALDGSRC